MRSSTYPLLVCICASALSGCDPAARPKTQPTAVEQAEQESHRWQQQYEAEQHLRQQSETRSTAQQDSRSRWQTAATVFAVGALALLIVGTILGSAARHESQQR